MSDGKFRVGFIGTGRPRFTEGATGFGMAYVHADGFLETGRCELVACADIVEDNARAFAGRYGIERVYADYLRMLADGGLDIVSICTWPDTHAAMVIASARSGVKAIHCEKPMAPTWGEAKEMVRVCDETGVKLTIGHQRRFLGPFQLAREMAHDGAIGELLRIEGNCENMVDWGTHWLDMFLFYNNETPVRWVMGQIDSRTEYVVFGTRLENQAVCNFLFEDGVKGLLETGVDNREAAAHRLVGTDGVVEIHWEAPYLRVLSTKKQGWQVIDQPDNLGGPRSVERGVVDIVEALATGRKSILDAHNAVRSTEIIFGTYESSRQRARIDLPLAIEDNPFLSMLAKGQLGKGSGG